MNQRKMKKSPFGGFSSLRSQTCGVHSLAGTAVAGGASSCEGYFAHWHEPNGLGSSTRDGNEKNQSKNKQQKQEVQKIISDLLFLQQRAFSCALGSLVAVRQV